MRRIATTILAAMLLAAIGSSPAPPPTTFGAVHVFVETGDEPLAAYQLDLRAATGNVRIVGIEGGEHGAFGEPPYYDPAAIEHDRVIIAALSTASAETLPRGRTRIATIHVLHTGDRRPEYEAAVTVAATVDGRPIPGRLTLETEPRP